MRTLLMMSVLLLAGCGDKDSGSDDDDDGGVGGDTGHGDAGWDGGGDGGAGDGGAGDGGAGDGGAGDGGGDGGAGDGGAGDGGAGDGGGDGGSSSGPCPDYIGFGEVGRVRTWQSSASYEASTGVSGEWSMTTARVGATTEIDYEATWYGDDGSLTETDGVYVYSCDDDGVALLSFDYDTNYTSPSFDYSSTYTATYSDPLLSFPADPASGDSWSDSWALTATGWTSTSGSYSTSSSGSTSYSLGSETTKTVPAGTFTVLPWYIRTTVSGHSSEQTSYMDADVGMVVTDSGELISVR